MNEEIEKELDKRLAKTNGRSYVRDQRISAERMQREQRFASSRKRKNDSLQRRSEPQTKQMKLEKKSRLNAAKMMKRGRLYSNREVNEHHNEMIERNKMFREDRVVSESHEACLRNYFKNYQDWADSKGTQMGHAAAQDDIHSKEIEYMKRVNKDKRIRDEHKRKMKNALESIDEEFVVSKAKDKKFSSLKTYFTKSKGVNVSQLERSFNEFYFSHIVGSQIRVRRFPEFQKQSEESDEEESVVVDDSLCSICSGPCIIDSKQGELVCTSCGVAKAGGFGIGLRQTFNESQSSSRSGAPYVRSSHVSFFIALSYPSRYPLLNSSHLIFSSSCSQISMRSPFSPEGISGIPLGLGNIAMTSIFY